MLVLPWQWMLSLADLWKDLLQEWWWVGDATIAATVAKSSAPNAPTMNYRCRIRICYRPFVSAIRVTIGWLKRVPRRPMPSFVNLILTPTTRQCSSRRKCQLQLRSRMTWTWTTVYSSIRKCAPSASPISLLQPTVRVTVATWSGRLQSWKSSRPHLINSTRNRNRQHLLLIPIPRPLTMF